MEKRFTKQDMIYMVTLALDNQDKIRFINEEFCGETFKIVDEKDVSLFIDSVLEDWKFNAELEEYEGY